ncbi:MAG: Ig-like domain-containing protein [Patescibacteria group bacterium]|nr:Ig-like domain-containing protein [Patescibacteria group bacterium]
MDTTKRFMFLTIGCAVAVIAGFLIYYFFFFPVEVIKTEPIGGSKNILRDAPITIFFNRKAPKILSENIKIVSEPSAEWGLEVTGDGREIVVNPQNALLAKTVYTLDIEGKRVKPYKFSFTTEIEEFGVGTPEAQTAFETYEKAFPILKFLPYRTEKYTIMQRQKDEYFVIIFGIYEKETENIKKEVLAWFRGKGVSPESVKIDFE